MRKAATVVIFILLTILCTFPAILHLTDRLIGDDGDNNEYFTYQTLVHDNLRAGKPPFAHTDAMYYPAGTDLQLTDGPLITVIGALADFFLPRVLTYNLLVLTIILLNTLAVYAVCRYLLSDWLVSLIATVIYALSYHELAFAGGFINLLPVYGPMLTVLGAILTAKRKKITTLDLLLFFGGLLITALSSLNSLLIVSAVFIIATPILYLLFKNDFVHIAQTIRLPVFGAIAIPFAGLMFVILSPWIHYLSLPYAFSNQQPFNPYPIVPLILPNTVMDTLLTRVMLRAGFVLPHLPLEFTNFLGYAELVIFSVFLVWPKKTKMDIFSICMFAIFFVLSFGPPALPFLKPVFLIYPFKGIFEPDRFIIVYNFFLAYGCGRALQQIVMHRGKMIRYAVLILTVLLLLSERVTTNYFSNDTHAYDFIPFLTHTTDRAILFLPLQADGSTSNNLFMLQTGKSIIDGYTHRAEESPSRERFIRAYHLDVFYCDFHDPSDTQTYRRTDLPVPEIVKSVTSGLRSVGVHYVVVNARTNNVVSCRDARRYISAFTDTLTPVRAFSDGTVYELK